MATARNSQQLSTGSWLTIFLRPSKRSESYPVDREIQLSHSKSMGRRQSKQFNREFLPGADQDQHRAKPFVLEADEPPVLLGKDRAANPVEYLLHALACCLTTSMVYHAAARGIQLQEVESTLEGDIDLHGFLELDKQVRNGYQGIRVSFKIKADVPDSQLQEITEVGSGHSPVFDSLAHGVPITVTAERLG